MDFGGGFSLKMKDVLKEASLLKKNKNGRVYECDLVILFARNWFLEAEILVHSHRSSSNPITTSVEDFIKGLHEGSGFLQKSFSPQLEENGEHHQILKLVDQVPGQVESLYYSPSQSEDLVGNRARDLLYKFIVRVMLFKAEVLLSELLKNEISLKTQIGALREGLIFLIKSDINQPKEDTEEEKQILADIERLAARVISVCDSYPADRNTKEEDVNVMESHLSDLLRFQLSDLLRLKVQPLKAKLKELYFQIPTSSFPKTPGLGSVRSVLEILKQLPSREHDSRACAKHQIEAIHGDLEFIICEYGHVFDEHTENQESIDDIHTRLVDAAYQVEHVIDSMAVERDPSSQQLMWLYHLSEMILCVKIQLIDYYQNNTRGDVGADTVTDPYGYQPLVSRPITSNIQEAMVGFHVEKSVRTDELIRDTNFAIRTTSEVGVAVTKMDFLGFSLKIKDVVKEASVVRNKNGRAYEYDLVILFARIWFLKAETLVHRSSSNPITTSVEDFINGFHQGSLFLQESFRPQEKTGGYHQILKLVDQVPRQVESLYRSSSQSEDLVGNRVRDLLYKFLIQVMLFKAEVLSLELLKNETSLMLRSKKTQIGTLREGLVFLIKSDIIQPKEDTEEEEEKLILSDIEGLAARVISVCDSCTTDRITAEAVNDMEFQISDLLVKVQLLKAKLKDLYFQIPRLNFPKTPGLGSIKSLLQNLKQLPSREHDSQACAKHQIEAIHGDLEFIIYEYGHVFDEHIKEQESMDDIHTQLVDAAYQVEHVIDLMAVGRDPLSQQLMWLYHLSEVIIHVKMQLIDYYMNNINSTRDVGADTDPYGYQPLESRPTTSIIQEAMVGFDEEKSVIYSNRYQPLESRPTTSIIQEAMVGFDEEKSVIIDELIRGRNQLKVVSITGMPGIGKTTLAKYVFSDMSVTQYFDIHAWCYVSQTYRKRNLLIGIISQLIEPRDNILTMSDEDLEMMLRKCLKGRRYLIALDDIWSTGVWDELCGFFPDDSNGSRVLMTSHLYNVVPNPLPLGRLSHDESWELLKMRIFDDNLCPPELLEVGNQVAKNCDGLPLAIVLVAGLLVGARKYKWHEIAESLSSLKVEDKVKEYMNIVERSYRNLQDQLKECFLYFGVIPRGEDISVRKLLWLWIAEGFIPKEEFKSLEDLAEEYLMDLIDRSLVMASKRRSNGKVKTCQVHGQILDFCLLKVKDAKFSQLLSGNPSYGMAEHSDPSDFKNSEHYRLSICGDTEQYIASRPSSPSVLPVRSLLFFARNEMYPGCYRDVSFISDNFILLKVLDLESINVGNTMENGIDLPVLLKYLAVGGDMDSLPSSLSKLQNLETLVVKGLMNKFVLPDTIWSMSKLRHIRVTNHCIFTFQQNDRNGNYSELESLVSLSLPSFSFGEETNSILRRLPNLQKLKCIVLEPRFGSTHVCLFPELGSLCRHLESLKLSYSGRPLNTVELEWNLPRDLTELTLSNFRLPWDQISAIGGRLPNLKVLKLISRAFEGSTWEMTEGEFLKLEYLKLESLNIINWDASEDHLPFLQQLVLRHCKQLVEVPPSFGEIVCLERIEVHQCGISAEESARRIVEEQLMYGNENLIRVFS